MLPAVWLWLLDRWAKCRCPSRQALLDCRPMAPEQLTICRERRHDPDVGPQMAAAGQEEGGGLLPG